jgi:glycerate kinase
MNILIAPNAFKNSLAAEVVAEAIYKGLQQSDLACSCTSFPVGDGGDGTAGLLIKHLKGKIITRKVHDPLKSEINSSFGIIENDVTLLKTAIIEMADASGLRLLKSEEYDPLHTTSFGTGELIKYAIEENAKKIILCVGGSATVDGGLGIMQALGAVFYNKKGEILDNAPASLIDLEDIDLSKIDKRIYDTELVILCDVENKLLGEEGSAAVFGPQKGASTEDVKQLDAALSKFRDVVLKKNAKDMASLKHGGAAGGVSAGLHALLNAKLVTGIEYFLDATSFDKALDKIDLVITGEGSIDTQTLQGKGPFGVAKRAKGNSIPVIGIAGKVPLVEDKNLLEYFDMLLPISNELMDIETAIKKTYENLVRTATELGDLINKKENNFFRVY